MVQFPAPRSEGQGTERTGSATRSRMRFRGRCSAASSWRRGPPLSFPPRRTTSSAGTCGRAARVGAVLRSGSHRHASSSSGSGSAGDGRKTSTERRPATSRPFNKGGPSGPAHLSVDWEARKVSSEVTAGAGREECKCGGRRRYAVSVPNYAVRRMGPVRSGTCRQVTRARQPLKTRFSRNRGVMGA